MLCAKKYRFFTNISKTFIACLRRILKVICTDSTVYYSLPKFEDSAQPIVNKSIRYSSCTISENILFLQFCRLFSHYNLIVASLRNILTTHSTAKWHCNSYAKHHDSCRQINKSIRYSSCTVSENILFLQFCRLFTVITTWS